MEKRFEISILLDFYGDLLTEKQRDIMGMYFNEDLSLGEIAEINATSRQAIHDIIKRCDKLLLEYESKLQLKYKSDRLSAAKQNIIEKCELIKTKVDDNVLLQYINDIEKEITENI